MKPYEAGWKLHSTHSQPEQLIVALSCWDFLILAKAVSAVPSCWDYHGCKWSIEAFWTRSSQILLSVDRWSSQFFLSSALSWWLSWPLSSSESLFPWPVVFCFPRLLCFVVVFVFVVVVVGCWLLVVCWCCLSFCCLLFVVVVVLVVVLVPLPVLVLLLLVALVVSLMRLVLLVFLELLLEFQHFQGVLAYRLYPHCGVTRDTPPPCNSWIWKCSTT